MIVMPVEKGMVGICEEERVGCLLDQGNGRGKHYNRRTTGLHATYLRCHLTPQLELVRARIGSTTSHINDKNNRITTYD